MLQFTRSLKEFRMKTAVIQLNARDNKRENIKNALKWVERAIAAKARFILLPEVFNYRGPIDKKTSRDWIAEDIPGESSVPFLSLAKKAKVFILLGSLYEKVRGTRMVYNTSVLIGNQGKIAGKYRKIHLFNAILGSKTIRESKTFLKGRKTTHVHVGGLVVGLTICYDLRFPSLYQSYAQGGGEVLCVPSAFTEKTGKAHWEVLLRARAIENLCYVLAPNQVGEDYRGIKAFGHSMIIDPWGEILAQASRDREEILYAYLEKERIREKRQILPGIVKINSRAREKGVRLKKF